MLDRRGKSWIVVVVVVVTVVTPDLIDAVSEPQPAVTNTGDVDVDADADTGGDDVVVALRGGLSAKGEPWSGSCSGGGDGVPPDSRTVTVDVIVFAVGATILLCAGAEDAMAPRPILSSRVRFCLPARRLSGNGPSSPSSLRTSIARATPRPRSPSIAMSERVRTMPPALTVLVVTPVLWNGSTLGAVRRAGESTESRPMFAPGKMSLGRRPCSDKVTLEKVEVDAMGRMRLWG
jgi:hypothetical protein